MMEESIIDIKCGRVSEKCGEDIIILKGTYFDEHSKFIENTKIVIKDNITEEIKEYPVDVRGYNLRLFIGKFSSTDREDIFISGETGGSGGYAIAILYKYTGGELKEVFNVDNFFDKYNCRGKYLENYRLQVVCISYKKQYILDISNIDKMYLENIYDENGKVMVDNKPTISYPNKIDVVNTLDDSLLNIQVYERIIGTNNSETLGYIKQLLSFKDSETKVIDEYVMSRGSNIPEDFRNEILRDKILEYIPKNAIIIKFNADNDFIIKDIDNDKRVEILYGYKIDKNVYLSVFREEKGYFKYLDTLKGEGFNISDLVITSLDKSSNKKMIIGWQIGAIWSQLDIVEFKNDRFKRLLKNDKIYYSKMEIIKYKSDGDIEIALWRHDTGVAYNIELYSFKDGVLKKTYSHDKEYFTKVYKYYKNLVDNSKDEPKYLFYYLANAAYKIGKKDEATFYLNKALKYPESALSIKELEDLKKLLQ